MLPAPAHVAPLPQPFSPVCEACGLALGSGFWITRYPRAAHTVCVDWRARAFPYAWSLPVLRTLYRSALPEERAELARIGTALRALEQQWPRHAAHAVTLAAHLVDRARALPVHRRTRPRL